MEANEIRVGNWLEWNKKPFKVCAIFRSVTENELWAKDNNELHPIPLTEELLLKCGFKVLKHEYDSMFLSINILETIIYLRPSYLGGFYWGFVVDKLECEINDCKRIEYLHQVQNLYWCLVGEELHVNL